MTPAQEQARLEAALAHDLFGGILLAGLTVALAFLLAVK
jgi:hypothetical protein